MTQIAADGGFVNDVNFINSSTTTLGSMQDTQIFVASNTFNAGATTHIAVVNSKNQDIVRNQVQGVTTASAWSLTGNLESQRGVAPAVEQTQLGVFQISFDSLVEERWRGDNIPTHALTQFTDKTWALGHVKFSFTA
mgnify:CR=1 FL=1